MQVQGLFDPTAINYKNVPYISWKSQTFQQVSSSIQKNNPTGNIAIGNIISKNSCSKTSLPIRPVKKPLPLKIYRRELTIYDPIKPLKNPVVCNPRTSLNIDLLNSPNGYLVVPNGTPTSGINSTLDLKTTNDKIGLPPGCSASLQQNGVCFDAGQNSLRRVRSAGMITKKNRYNTPGSQVAIDPANNPSNAAYNAPYSTSTDQYIYSRGKSFEQNQTGFLRVGNPAAVPGTAQSQNNEYAVNTGYNYCPNPTTNFVPTFYKPNNPKFAQQGGVTSSARLLRLKYDTVTTSGSLYATPFGSAVANAMAYRGYTNPYTIKEKIGFETTKTPVITNAGTLKCCTTSLVKKPN